MTEILSVAAEKFLGALRGLGVGDSLSVSGVVAALSKLLGGADGKLDLSAVVETIKGQGLGAMVQSWLGDSGNQPISLDAIRGLFGDKLAGFASELKVEEGEAANGLAAAIPSLIDACSQGGQLKDVANNALSSLKSIL